MRKTNRPHPNIKIIIAKDLDDNPIYQSHWVDCINDFVRLVIGSMKGRNFSSIRGWESNSSHSYYISFYPGSNPDDVGQLILEIELQTRKGLPAYFFNGKEYRYIEHLNQDLYDLLDRL